MKRIGHTGFSLASVIVAMGVVSGLVLIMAQLMKQTSEITRYSQSAISYQMIASQLDFSINSTAHCSVSLGGKTFQGSSINSAPIDFTVNLSKPDGSLSRIVLRPHTDQDKVDMRINSIHLNLPAYTLGANFPTGTNQSELGEITLQVERKTGPNTWIPQKDLKKKVKINFETDASGVSTITSCKGGSEFINKKDIIQLGISVDPTTGALPTTYTVPAETCGEAIRVDMRAKIRRYDTGGGEHSGIFSLLVNGVENDDWKVEFGAGKYGGSGHGWSYYSTLHKTFYITDISNIQNFESKIEKGTVEIYYANFDLTCL